MLYNNDILSMDHQYRNTLQIKINKRSKEWHYKKLPFEVILYMELIICWCTIPWVVCFDGYGINIQSTSSYLQKLCHLLIDNLHMHIVCIKHGKIQPLDWNWYISGLLCKHKTQGECKEIKNFELNRNLQKDCSQNPHHHHYWNPNSLLL